MNIDQTIGSDPEGIPTYGYIIMALFLLILLLLILFCLFRNGYCCCCCQNKKGEPNNGESLTAMGTMPAFSNVIYGAFPPIQHPDANKHAMMESKLSLKDRKYVPDDVFVVDEHGAMGGFPPADPVYETLPMKEAMVCRQGYGDKGSLGSVSRISTMSLSEENDGKDTYMTSWTDIENAINEKAYADDMSEMKL